MIRALVLFYLNTKPTHGYEIQKFIQMSGIEQWVKIQSGSIYYALTKLEKENHIIVLREEYTGSRGSKVYQITDSGKAELLNEMTKEFSMPLMDTGSPKFIIEPILNTLPKSQCESILSKHIKELKEKKKFWEKWKGIKAGDGTSKLLKLCFDMTINSIDDQIKWHKELLTHLDDYISQSKHTVDFIRQFDINKVVPNFETTEVDNRIRYVSQLKEVILADPGSAVDNLDKLLEELQKKKEYEI